MVQPLPPKFGLLPSQSAHPGGRRRGPAALSALILGQVALVAVCRLNANGGHSALRDGLRIPLLVIYPFKKRPRPCDWIV